jgi:phenylalanyl-tRNA synthetase alpha chain
MTDQADVIVEKVLATLDANGVLEDSMQFAKANKWDHNEVIGALNQLNAHEYIKSETLETRSVALTKDGEEVLQLGSPEARVFNTIPAGAEGFPMDKLNSDLGQVAKLGFAEGMKLKWVRFDKASGKVFRNVESINDATATLLKSLQNDPKSVPEQEVGNLKRRRLATEVTTKYFKVSKGPNFSPKFSKPAADITVEMLASGEWKEAHFKEYNFDAMGQKPVSGHLHPLMKVRAEIRSIFLELGFEEMPTNNYVESSFWNFDTLFQPQQHPARDAHDTFFLSDPATAPKFPEEYLERVKKVHTSGGYGSIGWRYDWKKIRSREKYSSHTHYCCVLKNAIPTRAKWIQTCKVFLY